MAQSGREEIINNCIPNGGNALNIECAVCLQTCVHPAELPCGHIFCYLCIKGIVNQGRRCAICRQDIPVDYLDKPQLLKPMDPETTSQGFEDGHLWFYEGYNGWWQYDERTGVELECAYQKGERCCDLLIAGFLYVADFDGMLQYRKSDPSRRRRIKRDLATTSKKGIAGLKATRNLNFTSSNAPEVTNEVIQNLSVSSSSPLNSLSGLRIFRSDLFDSIQNSEVENNESSSSCNLSTCRPSDSTNLTPSRSNSAPVNSTSVNYRNDNIDAMMDDTLDWTIEQIESLNSELLHDFETLFRDVNNYEQWEDNLNQSRYRRESNNYLSRYLNGINSPSALLNNDLDSANRISDLYHFSSNLNNSSSEIPSVNLQGTSSIRSEIRGIQSNRSLLPFGVENSLPPPLPPPRNRMMNRSRARRNSTQHSLSPSYENLFHEFIPNK